MKPIILLLLPLTLLAARPGNTARAYYSSKLDPKEHAVRRVLVLPVRLQLSKSGIKGREGMSRESEQLAASVRAVVVKELEARKLNVLPDLFGEQALRNDEELQATVNRLQSKYDTTGAQLHAKPKEVRKGRYSLGDEVATLPPAAEADAVVFIRSRGTAVTMGKSMFGNFAGGGGALNTLQTIVTFVDAKSGDVLAYVEVDKGGDFMNKTGQVIGKPIGKLLKGIPFMPK